MLIKSAGDPQFPKKLEKLEPRAHIGYLVGYSSTNIYRIWIPYKRKVISTRDILFDESSVYEHKPLPVSTELIKQLDKILVRIELLNEEPEHQIGQDEEAPTT